MTTALPNPRTPRQQDRPTPRYIAAILPPHSTKVLELSCELPELDATEFQNEEFRDFCRLAIECGAVGFILEPDILDRAESGKTSFCGECGE